MTYPRVEIDLNKIRYNTATMVKACHERGIHVAGVTKVFCGNKIIAQSLVDGGIDILADSRVKNLMKLSQFKLPKMLLRLPMISEVKAVIKYTDVALVSELKTIEALSTEAVKQNKIQDIILMIDLGDLREGIFYEDEISKTVKELLILRGVKLIGVGTNLTCYGGVVPTKGNLLKLINIKRDLEDKFQIRLDVISGGNSGSISLFKEDEIPKGINQLRLGASLSLGIGLNDEPIQGLYTNAFKLMAEIIEIKEKPSMPIGEIGLDAFGNKTQFKDKGIRKRALCGIGNQDIHPSHLIPYDTELSILGGSSDILILDITETKKNYVIGDKVEFDVTYGGCLSAMTSEYVHKIYK